MKSERLLLIAACLAYYFGLTISYAAVESQLFDSTGMNYYPPGLRIQLMAAAMATLPSLWLPIQVRYPSQVCYWILYITVVVPMMFIPYHVLPGQDEVIFVLPLSIFVLFGLLTFCLKMPLFRLPRVNINPEAVYWSLQIALVLLTLVVVYINGSFRLDLSLDDVYTRRLDAREEVSSGSLTAYAMTTLSYALAPVALLMGYARRHYAVAAMAILAFLFIYSYRATKTDLLMPVFLIGICILLRNRKLSFGPAIVLSALMFVMLSMFEYFTFETSTLSGYLIRRQLIGPSLLTSYYWDFFSYQPLMYYSDKFYASYFVSPQYDLQLARLIGYEYLGNAENNANTCFWAAAFANLGYSGMLLVTILLAMILRLMDSIAEHGDLITASTMAGLFGMQLSNGSLENCMITGGVAVSFMLLFCLRGNGRAAAKSLRPRPLALCRKEIVRTWIH